MNPHTVPLFGAKRILLVWSGWRLNYCLIETGGLGRWAVYLFSDVCSHRMKQLYPDSVTLLRYRSQEIFCCCFLLLVCRLTVTVWMLCSVSTAVSVAVVVVADAVVVVAAAVDVVGFSVVRSASEVVFAVLAVQPEPIVRCRFFHFCCCSAIRWRGTGGAVWRNRGPQFWTNWTKLKFQDLSWTVVY